MLFRFFRSLTLAAMLAGMLPLPALAARFADVSSSTQYSAAIEALAAKGIVSGQADGKNFAPKSAINRAEFSKIIAEAIFTDEQIAACDLESRKFPDIASGIWYEKYVCALADLGAISGYPDGTFKGEQTITFVEAAKILSVAYGQKPPVSYGEWYEGYASALEESKAIPTSIVKLDSKLTRAEMAEMLWRVMEGKTDQTSKAVVNLKNPELKVNLASDIPQRATSCADLNILSQQQSTRTDVMYYRDDMGGAMPPAANQAVMEKSADSAAPTGGGGDYSQTNVQVEGVDEADIVKTDGKYLYIVRTNEKSRVAIVQASPLKEVASIDLTNLGIMAQEIYVEDGKLTVIGTTFTNDMVIMDKKMDSRMMIWPPIYQSSKTAVAIFDVRTPASPKELRVLKFDGNQLSTRRIGNKLYVVLQSQPYWGGPMPMVKTDNPVPQFEDSKTGVSKAMVPCVDVMIMPRIPSPSYLAVAVVRLDDTSKDVQTEVILGDANNVYSSTENLYVATTRYAYQWHPLGSSSDEQTQIYRFAFTDDGVKMEAQGKVPGHLLNQFSMDESGDNFRVATTVSPTWGSDGEESHSQNGLYVLNRAMEQIGQIENIAPGETIYSARFMGKRAYLVTFKQVDPFFVVDLSNPRAPKILGQLKIPGYSNYLHPYDDTHVIGIGKDVDESIDVDKVHSDDAVYYTAIQGVKMSLFDVTDVTNPKEMHKVIIGDRGSETTVTSNHKALLFEKDRNLLALPVLVTKRPAGSAKSADAPPVFQGAYVYNLTLNKGFEQLGTITHYDDPQVFLKAGGYWYNQGSDIDRIVRIDSDLFTISQNEVRSHTYPGIKAEEKMTFAK